MRLEPSGIICKWRINFYALGSCTYLPAGQEVPCSNDGLPAEQLSIAISKKLLEAIQEAALKHYKNAASDALMNKIEEKAGELFDSFKSAFSDDDTEEK